MSATYAMVSFPVEPMSEERLAELQREREREAAEERERMARWRFQANVFYDPAAAEVELLAVLEDDVAYEFDIALVLRDLRGGKVYVVRDRGCSCPTPFEDVHELSDLTEVRSAAEVELLLRHWGAHWPAARRGAFVRKVRRVLP